MRGGLEEARQLFSYVDIEDCIAVGHLLCAVRALVEQLMDLTRKAQNKKMNR